jgi:aldose 1-epimerase
VRGSDKREVRMKIRIAAALGTIVVLAAMAALAQSKGNSIMKKQDFGTIADGRTAHLYTLSNSAGTQISIMDYGATVVSIRVADRKNQITDIALGYDDAASYEKGDAFFGGTIGRYGNRIAKGKFTLDGKTYTLLQNNNGQSLHGGSAPFSKVMWNCVDASSHGTPILWCDYVSKDGEGGYPGNLSVKVTFSLSAKSEFKIEYSATTDKDTVVNLTNHTYFNLAGEGSGDILKQRMMLHASKFTPVDDVLIPTGELRPVAGTPFDFTKSTEIGARIDQDDQQLKFAHGYDHNWMIDGGGGAGRTVTAAEAYDQASGRVLTVTTTEPGIQFYSGNFLDGTIHGKGGKVYGRRSAFCLETQHFPDSPNHPNFPSTELKPGMKLSSMTIYRFSTR